MKKIFEMSKDGKSEYCINVVKIGKLTPIEGSDFLAQTYIGDASLVVRKDQVTEGDLMFYASNECQLNEKFLSSNNLFDIGNYELNSNHKEVEALIQNGNKDEAKKKCGYFSQNGRIRMIRLKGVPSMGYLFSVEEMANYCPKVKDVNLEEWVNIDFDTVDGELFVKAYVPPIKKRPQRGDTTRKRNKKLDRFDRMIPGEFSYHYDTSQLSKNMLQIHPTDKVAISNKMHGCVERNTVVTTEEFGDKTIGDIVDNKIQCHIKAYDTFLKQIVYVPIDNFYVIPNDGEWYEIELSNGVTIKITGNNPVWCENLQCYRRVDELDGSELLIFDKSV